MKRALVLAVSLASLGLSASALADPPTYPVGTDPQGVAAGDFNGDGRADLAVANRGADTVGVLLRNADGTFQSARNSPTGSSPTALLVGDLNGDGRADVVTSDGALLGNGDGTFQAPRVFHLPPQAPWGQVLQQIQGATALGDVDGDGTPDLVVAATTSNYSSGGAGYSLGLTIRRSDGWLNVMLGNGDGTFAAATVTHLGMLQSTKTVALADFNGDGATDVVTDGPSVRLGNGDGTLQAARWSGFNSALLHVSTPVADFDKDGRPDVLTQDGAFVLFCRGNGDGTFQRGDYSPFDSTVHSAAVGDVDADGTPDVVLAGARTESTVSRRFAVVLLGDGNGTFGFSAEWDLGTAAGLGQLASTVLADLDGDGLPEVAVADSYNGLVAVGRNPGDWPTPKPSIRIDNVLVTEGDSGTTPAVFTVRLNAPWHEEIAVDFSTRTAYVNDIVATQGTVRFAPGETRKSITVQVVGDRITEDSESFQVLLANPTPNAVVAWAWGNGTIFDNDPQIEARIDDVSHPEGRSGTTPFVFTVSLSRAPAVQVTVPWFTADGAATAVAKKGAAADYVAASGTLTFAVGQTTKTIAVAVTGDRTVEPNETFFVQLGAATNASVVDGSGLGTIVNDD